MFTGGVPGEAVDRPDIDEAIAAKESAEQTRGEIASRLPEIYDRLDGATEARRELAELKASRRDLFPCEAWEVDGD